MATYGVRQFERGGSPAAGRFGLQLDDRSARAFTGHTDRVLGVAAFRGRDGRAQLATTSYNRAVRI